MSSLSRFVAIFLLLVSPAYAQFLTTGTIDYERRTNLHRLYEEELNGSISKEISKFQVAGFRLKFTEEKSRYAPVDKNSSVQSVRSEPGTDNLVYQDYGTGMVSAVKHIFEQRFEIVDTARGFRWHMVDEERTIAGYQCRKAVTRICDSVYVVAFYAYDIPVSGGPERFCGLPGMILELAVPRLYTTWLATAVSTEPVSEADIISVTNKGKTLNSQQLQGELTANLPIRQKARIRILWWSNI